MIPKILVSFSATVRPTDQEYLTAIAKAGGEPTPIRPGSSIDVSSFHGLLLTGGEDIDPRLYGEDKLPSCGDIVPLRDTLELTLFGLFLKGNKPTLGICRGEQFIDLFIDSEGPGALYQDLASQYPAPLLPPHQDNRGLPHEEMRKFLHEIKIVPGSRLQQILGGAQVLPANSQHHQAVKRLASSLTVEATAPDGVIEAVRSTQHRWVMGVQWHPEAREVHHIYSPLFDAFVAECKQE